VITSLSPSTLREVASAMEAMSPEKRAVDELSDEGVVRLADILINGSRPTVSFWRKYRCAP
jgi:hypothetical protein